MLSVDDWAEIRRLHRAEVLPVKPIARLLGISRNTVRSAARWWSYGTALNTPPSMPRWPACARTGPGLTVCQLPPYVYELNPVELAWSHPKRSLANLAKRNLPELTALARTRLKRMQYRPGLIDSFLAKTGLDPAP